MAVAALSRLSSGNEFWGYVRDALFDMGVLCLCGLFDESKDIKNLSRIESCLAQLKSGDTYPRIDEEILKIHNTVHEQRDLRIAHPLRQKAVPSQFYKDPAMLCNEAFIYIQSLHKYLYNGGYGDTVSLKNIIINQVNSVCRSVGIASHAAEIRKETVTYIDSLTAGTLGKA